MLLEEAEERVLDPVAVEGVDDGIDRDALVGLVDTTELEGELLLLRLALEELLLDVQAVAVEGGAGLGLVVLVVVAVLVLVEIGRASCRERVYGLV